MPNRKPTYYWDTCIWLAWVKNEVRPNGEMAGVEDIVDLASRNRVSIIVSDAVSLEILDGKWPPGAAMKFDDLFKRRNIKKVPITPNITDLSQFIRNYYHNRGEKTASSLDAVHLATAIVYRVDQMHTFDDGQAGKKHRSLLGLNGDVAGHKLVICKPPLPAQPRLF